MSVETTEVVRRYLEGDAYAKLADIELVSIAPGHARAKMKLGPQHLNGYGKVQGGAIFTLADLAFAAASNAYGTVAVGINVTISYMKAAETGTLWAEAKEVSKNFKLGTYLVEVKDDAGDLVALFQGMAYRKQESIAGGNGKP
jgi:acyl-CoA thioesterase